MAFAVNPYGDGDASIRIIDYFTKKEVKEYVNI